jgi:hypothetical protein
MKLTKPDSKRACQTELDETFRRHQNLLTVFGRARCNSGSCTKAGADGRSLSSTEQGSESTTDRSPDARGLSGLLALTLSAEFNDAAANGIRVVAYRNAVQLQPQLASTFHTTGRFDIDKSDVGCRSARQNNLSIDPDRAVEGSSNDLTSRIPIRIDTVNHAHMNDGARRYDDFALACAHRSGHHQNGADSNNADDWLNDFHRHAPPRGVLRRARRRMTPGLTLVQKISCNARANCST